MTRIGNWRLDKQRAKLTVLAYPSSHHKPPLDSGLFLLCS